MAELLTKCNDFNAVAWEFRQVYKFITQLLRKKYRIHSDLVVMGADSDTVIFGSNVVPDDMETAAILVNDHPTSATFTKVSDNSIKSSVVILAGATVQIFVVGVAER